ncbi:lysophospholipase L1-like esterase [Chitinophaga niastensis]|uniref:Lysophospholipase L1-like esterase n=1 Tax=Chitinophaga niastensis TaxID=536980 RepID=A0A2P8HA45_CHINA|nr:GDSL-type esterase/lipase family protein [Chitinophaga niastensis]PSL43095.1 lysophospholipase L1-like esterase [Chitinophaga niastensis]
MMIKRPFIILVISLLTGVTAAAQSKKLNIVFIGNSITHGAGLANPLTDAPPVQACNWLREKMPAMQVAYSNQGVSGATTVDFLPATNSLFNNVIKAANTFKSDKDATLVFSMILGTNDSASEGPNGSPVSPADYEANVKIIMNRLLADYPGCIIILHRPIWYSPNTQNGARYLVEGLARLQSYFPVLDKIVKDYQLTNPKQVFSGDVKGFAYFKKHPEFFQQEQGKAGIFLLHPNEKGAAALGLLWGKAIKNRLSI